VATADLFYGCQLEPRSVQQT